MKNLFTCCFLFLLITAGCKKKVETPVFVLRGEIQSPDITEIFAITENGLNRFEQDTLKVINHRFELKKAIDTLVQVNLYYGDRLATTYAQAPDTINIFIKNDSVYIEQSKYRSNVLAALRLKKHLNQYKNPHKLKMAIDSIPDMPILIKNQVETYLNQLRKAPIGNKIPYLLFRDKEGKSFNLMETSGSYCIISFWASWDSTSVNQIKQLASISKKYNQRALEFVTLSLDSNDSIWEEKVKEYKIPGRNYRLKKGFSDQAALNLGIETIPQNIITDTTVTIVQKNIFADKLLKWLEEENITSKKSKRSKKDFNTINQNNRISGRKLRSNLN